MPPAPRYALTVTARTEPPLTDAHALGQAAVDDQLCILMSSHGDGPDSEPYLASWTVTTSAADPTTPLAALHDALAAAVRAEGATFQLEELTAVTVDHLARQARIRERGQLVGVEEFRELLAPSGRERMSRSQFFELASRDGFPPAVRPGKWTRHQATAYATERGTPRRGRPPGSRQE